MHDIIFAYPNVILFWITKSLRCSSISSTGQLLIMEGDLVGFLSPGLMDYDHAIHEDAPVVPTVDSDYDTTFAKRTKECEADKYQWECSNRVTYDYEK